MQRIATCIEPAKDIAHPFGARNTAAVAIGLFSDYLAER